MPPHLLLQLLPQILIHHRLLRRAVIQLRFFQLWIHVVMPFFRYSESVTTSTSQDSLMRRRPSMAAVSSMRLLVVCGAKPEHFPLVLVVAQDRSPAARTGIAAAGAVGDHFDLLHDGERSLRAPAWKNSSTRSRICCGSCAVIDVGAQLRAPCARHA